MTMYVQTLLMSNKRKGKVKKIQKKLNTTNF